MEKWRNEDTDALFRAILSLQTLEECYLFFDDVCTVKEISDLAQRLKTAKMLSSGANYQEIGRVTGMSTATISRVSKCIEYGNGGYRLVIDREEKKDP